VNPLLLSAATHVGQWEGFCPHIYLDTVGAPTIAYGFNIDFTERKEQLSVATGWSLNAIERDIESCENFAEKKDHHNIIAARYEDHTNLRIDSKQAQTLLADTLEAFVGVLKANDLDVSTMPHKAALVVVDMAYNLGISGLLRKFPKFVRYVRMRDWAAASKECKRRGIGDARNNASMQMLMDL
jgi:GH24 family phage-related lysozyme (muramidase)